MADKDLLKQMVNAIVTDDTEQAQVAFHQFATQKMRELVSPAPKGSDETDATNIGDDD